MHARTKGLAERRENERIESQAAAAAKDQMTMKFETLKRPEQNRLTAEKNEWT